MGTEHLAFLDDSEQRTLNHIRAFSYAHLLGNFEEFIPVQMSEVAGQNWHDDRPRMRALFRFGEEEMKHQQLFRRTEEVLEASCGRGFGRYFDLDKVKLTTFVNAVLAYPLLPRFLLLTAFELGTQRHYVESVRTSKGAASDPLYVDVLKHHWIEESQHVKLDLLEAARLAAGMSSDELSQAFDGVWDWEALSAKQLRGRSSRSSRPSRRSPDGSCRNRKQRRCAIRSPNLCKRSWSGSRCHIPISSSSHWNFQRRAPPSSA